MTATGEHICRFFKLIIPPPPLILLFPKHSNPVCRPFSIVLNGHRGAFSRKSSGWFVKLSTHLHSVAWLRMRRVTRSFAPYTVVLYTGTSWIYP